jgi:hypothetical protein
MVRLYLDLEIYRPRREGALLMRNSSLVDLYAARKLIEASVKEGKALFHE